MAESNVPHDWSAQLRGEADRWVRDGLITAEQRAAILKLYPAPENSGRERTILIFTLLGSLLVGAGVILFFAANWQALSAAVKLSAIIAAIVAAYGTGYYLQFIRGDYPRLGHSLIFLGGLFYGAGIWLVAQIFHLDSHFPTGFLLWGVGVLPVAAATGSVWMLYLGTAALGIWTAAEADYSSMGFNWLAPVLLLGVVTPLARRMQSALAEAGALFCVILWFLFGVFQTLPAPTMNSEPFVGARLLLIYGGVLFAAGLARLGDERTYLGLGGAVTLTGAYILTFRWGILGQNLAMPSLLSGSAFHTGGLIVMAAATFAVAAVLVRRRDVAAAAVTFVPLLVAFSAQFLDHVPRMITFNLLLFAGTVAWMLIGIRRRNQIIVNLALAAFLIHVLTRYFDLFFSAMNRSLFFVLGGALLLGGGWLLERNRRRWMSDWGGDGDDA